MALTVVPIEPFPNLIKYDWNQPELISWFHRLAFTIEGTISSVNDASSNTIQSPLSSDGLGLSDLEGLGQFNVFNTDSININTIMALLKEAFSRGLFGGLSSPLNINEEESDFPLIPLG